MFNKDKPVEILFAENCTKCGLCAENCPGEHLIKTDSGIKINDNSLFGCIQCGHCMISCPVDALSVRGEGISEKNVYELAHEKPDYQALYNLFSARRSTRKFMQKEISKELIDKIICAASTGAISIPPYEVKVLVINDSEKVKELAQDITSSLSNMTKVINNYTIALLKPFIGKLNYKMFKEFVFPLINATVQERKRGNDILFYNAPAIILFYTTPVTEGVDAHIAATLASIAAESLGLGSCIIGTVPPAINKNPEIKEKLGIAKNETIQHAMILGYPAVKYIKGIKREFKETRYL